jgi:NAD-dependent SIR2 family protein deacetylase
MKGVLILNNCKKCGKSITDEDTYEYQDHLFCEVCAKMLQENDFSRPDVMGCDGPVGTYGHR